MTPTEVQIRTDLSSDSLAARNNVRIQLTVYSLLPKHFELLTLIPVSCKTDHVYSNSMT